ncbi:MAG: tetratricopeptide repeat protein, partial [Myxococcaceae bacterium]
PTPSSSPLPRLHRPPTPPSSPVALHPGEESPLVVAARGVALAHPGATPASMPRLLLLGGLTVLGAAFLGTTLWVRVGAPSREPLHRPAPVPRAVDETELDRLLAQARERIDAHDDAGAEEAAMRAAAVDPSDARAYLLLGRIALRLGNAPRARSELERVLSLEPSGTRADEARALLSSIP